MRFVADTADFPAICHVSDAKDITRNRRETSFRHEQFGKGIVKYNGFKQNFTLFCSTSEPKGVSLTKLRMTSRLKLQMCLTGLKRSLTCCAEN